MALYNDEKNTDQQPLLPSTSKLHQRDAQIPKMRQRRHCASKLVKVGTLASLASLALIATSSWAPQCWIDHIDDSVVSMLVAPATLSSTDTVCPQQEPWVPEGLAKVDFPENAVLTQRLSEAVQIDTTVHDEQPDPDVDNSAWEPVFAPFREWLQKTYPLVHSGDGPVSLELVHKHGLLYTWPGANDTLKPLLLMAHQDVVPVDPETIDSWEQPPFSGAIKDGFVWGRGSVDDKPVLTSILSSVEAMLKSGVAPERTLLIAVGFDEEANGLQGGRYLGRRIEEIWGQDSVYMIVDEGIPILPATDPLSPGETIALPATDEKGNIHIKLRIEAPGGHSSRPPVHTTVGMLSEIVTEIENGQNLKQPVIPDTLESAHLKMLQCMRDHMPPNIRKALKTLEWADRSGGPKDSSLIAGAISGIWDLVLQIRSKSSLHSVGCGGAHPERRDARQRRVQRAIDSLLAVLPDSLKINFVTTQTPTVFRGGIKLNAIPPSAQVEIDHRVALHNTVDDVKEWYRAHLTNFAKKRNLSLRAFGEDLSADADNTSFSGKMIVDSVGVELNPTPSPPLTGAEAAPWHLLSSLIRGLWVIPNEDGEGTRSIRVSPSSMGGNTDTRSMHALTKHIFRFAPSSPYSTPQKREVADESASTTEGQSLFSGVHGVNEHFLADGLDYAIRFYTSLILSWGSIELEK